MSPTESRAVPGGFHEIRALLEELPAAAEGSAEEARRRQAELTKPPGSLGRLEEIAVWLSAWQDRHPPAVERPHVAVFAGNHGIARRGVSAYPPEVTGQMMRNFIDGGAAINQLSALVDADLRVYEMALDHPTADFSEAPALEEAECMRAIAYGMQVVEPGIDVLALGEMGIGNTTSAAAICHALFGGEAGDWVGRGTGIDDERLAGKRALVAAAVERHAAARTDGLEVLRHFGGRELAAIVGAILAARMARVPVLLDGYACTAAAAVLHALEPEALAHCMVAHCSAEPGHRRLLSAIGACPLLELGMRLGEASGAATAVLLLKAACACHCGMATFAEAGVSGPDG